MILANSCYAYSHFRQKKNQRTTGGKRIEKEKLLVKKCFHYFVAEKMLLEGLSNTLVHDNGERRGSFCSTSLGLVVDGFNQQI